MAKGKRKAQHGEVQIGARPRTRRRLFLIVQRLGKVGGQERSTLEVMTRLARMGWRIEVLSFHLSDWPKDLQVKWHRVPRLPIGLQLVQNLWFGAIAAIAVVVKKWYEANTNPSVVVTLGTASPLADVRVLQFINGAALARYKQGTMPYPNARGPVRRLYQKLFAQVEAKLEGYLLSRSRQLIAISKAVADDARAYSSRPLQCQVDVVPYAPDRLSSRHGHRVAKASTPMTILFVGILERKGIEKALGALRHLLDLDWRFKVIGRGDIKRWKARAAKYGIADRVDFVGTVPAAKHFATATVFLLPSVYEPFGLVVTEAVSYGLAPLVSRECGAMEQWPQRPDWLCLSCRDSDELWALSLRRLLGSETLRTEIAAQARRAMYQWTWDDAAERYHTILARLTPEELRKAA